MATSLLSLFCQVCVVLVVLLRAKKWNTFLFYRAFIAWAVKCIGRKTEARKLNHQCDNRKEKELAWIICEYNLELCVCTCSLFSYYLHIGTPFYFQTIACFSRSVHLQLAAAIHDLFSMKRRWIIPILRKTCHQCMCVLQAHIRQWTQNLNQIKIMQHSCSRIYALRLYI